MCGCAIFFLTAHYAIHNSTGYSSIVRRFFQVCSFNTSDGLGPSTFSRFLIVDEDMAIWITITVTPEIAVRTEMWVPLGLWEMVLIWQESDGYDCIDSNAGCPIRPGDRFRASVGGWSEWSTTRSVLHTSRVNIYFFLPFAFCWFFLGTLQYLLEWMNE
jgi:hypothetical protein